MGNEKIKTAGSAQSAPDAKKTKKRPFELRERCQDLTADIYTLTANAPKELRVTICKKVQDTACETVHAVRLANACKLGSSDRKNAQLDAIELIDRLGDLLPVLTKCRCITPEQETLITKKLDNIRSKYDIWLAKDHERLEQLRAKKSSANISVQTENPSSNKLSSP